VNQGAINGARSTGIARRAAGSICEARPMIYAAATNRKVHRLIF
jgi:hypothetical protein